MSKLSNNNPFQRPSCERSRHPLRESENLCYDRCYKEGILYQAVCLRCHKEQEESGSPVVRDSLYLGESSRTLYTRYQQHIQDYRRASRRNPSPPELVDTVSSWMWDHAKEKHGGPSSKLEEDYQFTVLSSHRDPMTRQISEAVRINRALEARIHTTARDKEVPINSLNRKGECFAPMERWEEQQYNRRL